MNSVEGDSTLEEGPAVQGAWLPYQPAAGARDRAQAVQLAGAALLAGWMVFQAILGRRPALRCLGAVG